MKQFIVNTLFFLGDLVSKSWMLKFEWGYDIYYKPLFKY